MCLELILSPDWIYKMNLAIFYKNTNELSVVLNDVVKISDREYRGKTRGSWTGKPEKYDLVLTNAKLPKMKVPTKHNANPKTIMKKRPVPVPIFEGQAVDSAVAVNAVTRAKIEKQYHPSDEAKMLRLRLSGGLSDDEWNKYNDTVSGIVLKGREFKNLHFKGV